MLPGSAATGFVAFGTLLPKSYNGALFLTKNHRDYAAGRGALGVKGSFYPQAGCISTLPRNLRIATRQRKHQHNWDAMLGWTLIPLLAAPASGTGGQREELAATAVISCPADPTCLYELGTLAEAKGQEVSPYTQMQAVPASHHANPGREKTNCCIIIMKNNEKREIWRIWSCFPILSDAWCQQSHLPQPGF